MSLSLSVHVKRQWLTAACYIRSSAQLMLELAFDSFFFVRRGSISLPTVVFSSRVAAVIDLLPKSSSAIIAVVPFSPSSSFRPGELVLAADLFAVESSELLACEQFDLLSFFPSSLPFCPRGEVEDESFLPPGNTVGIGDDEDGDDVDVDVDEDDDDDGDGDAGGVVVDDLLHPPLGTG